MAILTGGSPDSSIGKKSACNSGDPGSIPGLGRPPGEGICYPLRYSWASLVAQLVKNPPAMRETWVWSLGWEDSLEKGKVTCSSILAWRIPQTTVHGVAKSWARLSNFHFHLLFQWFSSVFPGPAASVLPEQLVRSADPWAPVRPESETLGVGPRNLCSNKPSKGFWWSVGSPATKERTSQQQCSTMLPTTAPFSPRHRHDIRATQRPPHCPSLLAWCSKRQVPSLCS